MRMFGIIFAILFSMRMFYFCYSLFYENVFFLFLFFSVFLLYTFLCSLLFSFLFRWFFVPVRVKQVMWFYKVFIIKNKGEWGVCTKGEVIMKKNE